MGRPNLMAAQKELAQKVEELETKVEFYNELLKKVASMIKKFNAPEKRRKRRIGFVS